MDNHVRQPLQLQQLEGRNMGSTSWGAWGLALSQQMLQVMVSTASLPWMRSQYALTPPSSPTTPRTSSNAYNSLSPTCASSSASTSAIVTEQLCAECATRASADPIMLLSLDTHLDVYTSMLPSNPSLDSSDACPSLIGSSTATSPTRSWWSWSRPSADAGRSAQVLCANCKQRVAILQYVPSPLHKAVHETAHQDVSSWLQQQDSRMVSAFHAQGTEDHPLQLHTRSGAGKVLWFATKSVLLTAAVCKLVPAGMIRGSTRRAAFIRSSLCVAGLQWLRRDSHAKQLSEPTLSTAHSISTESAAGLLNLPHMTWLNEDFAQRLMAQTDQDVAAARQRAAIIHTWRQQLGLDRLVYPPHHTAHFQDVAAANPASHQKQHSHAWHLTKRLGSSVQPQSTLHATSAQGMALPAHHTSSMDSCLAAAAAARFDAVARVVGCTLAYIDDTHGMAVLWVQGEALSGVKAGLCAPDVLGTCAARAAAKGQEAVWLAACAHQAAVMSDWIWRVRLRDQPVHAGRYVQVVDLKGLRLSSALTEGLAVVRSIMSAGHNFPQRLAATIIINPPTGLTLVWNMIAQLLPHAVVAKIKIVRGGHAAVIQELTRWMPVELIPSTCGGKCDLPLHQYPAQQELCKAMAAARCLPATAALQPSTPSR